MIKMFFLFFFLFYANDIKSKFFTSSKSLKTLIDLPRLTVLKPNIIRGIKK